MKLNKLSALVLAATLCISSTAFAKTTEKVEEKKVYTYEQILDIVIKNNSDLDLMEENLELMNKQSSNLAQGLGGLVYPSDTSRYVPSESYEALAGINSLAVAKRAQKYEKEAILISAEYSVMSTLSSINICETALEYADEEYEVYKQTYNMMSLKHNLGMISEVDVITAKTTMDEFETAVVKAKANLESLYSSLRVAMGISEIDFEIDFNVEYVPFKVSDDLDAEITKRINKDPTIVGTKINIEDTIANIPFTLANDTTPYGYDNLMYKINTAEAALKSTQDALDIQLESVYKSFADKESEIKGYEDSLEIAKKNLTATEENYTAGRATKLALDEAELAVKKLENAIQASKDKYMLAVFSFNNPTSGNLKG